MPDFHLEVAFKSLGHIISLKNLKVAKLKLLFKLYENYIGGRLFFKDLVKRGQVSIKKRYTP